MRPPSLNHRALLSSFLLALGLAACDSSATSPDEATSFQKSASATVELSEFPVNVDFQFYSACLDTNVRLAGTAYWSVRTVTRPDGAQHLTILMDVAGPTISANGSVWTASPGASEMFVRNFPPGSDPEQQLEHQGTVIYRTEDGGPDLRFVHRIHLVRLPSGEVQLNKQLFEIVCVGRN